MQDTSLFCEMLGLKPPWKVSRVQPLPRGVVKTPPNVQETTCNRVGDRLPTNGLHCTQGWTPLAMQTKRPAVRTISAPTQTKHADVQTISAPTQTKRPAVQTKSAPTQTKHAAVQIKWA